MEQSPARVVACCTFKGPAGYERSALRKRAVVLSEGMQCARNAVLIEMGAEPRTQLVKSSPVEDALRDA